MIGILVCFFHSVLVSEDVAQHFEVALAQVKARDVACCWALQLLLPCLLYRDAEINSWLLV